MEVTSPDDLVTYSQHTTSGRTFRCSRRTAAHLDSTKAALAAQHPGAQMLIAQGCYNTGVAASAGTHDYDAVLDFRIPGLDWWAAQRFLREQGWAAWYRHTGSWAASRSWHLHAVSLGYRTRVGRFVPAQVGDYYRRALGLKGQHAPGSDSSWHPASVAATVFDYYAWINREDQPMTPEEKKAQAAIDAGFDRRLTALEGQVSGRGGLLTVGGKRLNVATALSRLLTPKARK